MIDDIRYALRWLVRRPRFTIAGVLILAIGLGSTTAAFSVYNWLLIRPLPGINDYGRLGTVWFEQASHGSHQVVPLSYPNYADVNSDLTALRGLTAFRTLHVSTATPEGVAHPVVAEFVAANYGHVLEIPLQVGRWFDVDEDKPPFGAPVVVISDRIWTNLFNRDPHVLGNFLDVRDTRVTVIGVTPPGFHGVDRFGDADLWLPSHTEAYVTHSLRPATIQERAWGGFRRFVARLAPGATLPQARDQLQARLYSLAALPEIGVYFSDVQTRVVAGVGVDAVGTVAHQAILILGITVLVLIIACTNVANLLLIRGLNITGEMAVRHALGAGMMRLQRQQMTVAIFLALGGCVAGVPIGIGLVRAFNGVRFARLSLPSVPFDWRVFVFAFGIALIVGMLAGMAPTLAIRRLDLVSILKNTSRTATGRRSPLKRAFAVAQVAVSVVLVVGALLLFSTLRNLARVKLGFQPDGVVLLHANPGQQGYSSARQVEYWRELVRREQAVPGVRDVATASLAPFLSVSRSSRVTAPGDPSGATVAVEVNDVSPEYFSVLGIPVVRGRRMTASDSGQNVVVLNTTLARRLFGATEPVGSTVKLFVSGDNWEPRSVVGVVADSRWNSLTDQIEAFLYTPRVPGSIGTVVLVRSSLSNELITAASQRVAAELDRTVPLEMNVPLSDGIESFLSERRILTKVLGLLALIGCTLAGFGLYAAIAFTAVQRTHEFGVRLALGAEGRDILMLVLREGAHLAGVGIAIGLVGAALASRLLQNRLYGVTALDPTTYAATVLILCVVVLLAGLTPAYAATKIAPATAAKWE